MENIFKKFVASLEDSALWKRANWEAGSVKKHLSPKETIVNEESVSHILDLFEDYLASAQKPEDKAAAVDYILKNWNK